MFQPKTRMQLQEYVKSLLPLTLGAAAGSGLIIHDSANLMDSFPNDDQSMVLFVLKHHSTPDGDYRFTAYSQLQPYDESQVAWLALIKRRPVLDMEQPFGQQLQLVNLPCGVIYETLHSYVRNAFTPFFNMSMMTGAASNGVSSAGAVGGERSDKLVAKKKLAELELSLLHLQQNVEIPQVALTIHPIIQRAAASAKTAGKRLSLEFVDEITLADPAFLNQLQADVNGWIREIQKVTKLTREVASGTASQEINFWLALERELERVEQQLRSDQVNLVMDVLKHAKRFHATMSFLADTGLKDAVDTAQKYNILMKDFPLGELLSAADLQKIQEALIGIFGHVNKKLRLSPYPVKRSLDLMEAISLDLNDQLIRLLGSRKLMHLDYQEFERLMAQLNQVFEVWDEQLKDFTNVAREIVRKRSEKFIPIKVVTAHSRLQERINFIWNFRRQHYQLHDTIVKVSDDGATIAVKDIDDAYECVRNINVLDISEDGTEIWVAGESSYNSRVSRVENQITARLRDLLAAARNASEMFRVFSRYNALFIRPKIRGAIQEYQTQLIENVKQDITKLHDKFKMQYQHSAACKMSAVRDIPPVAGAIIWARQIDRQLAAYMKRVEDVLGAGWEMYADGQKLQAESINFRKKLDTRPIFDNWLSEISRRNIQITGPIFAIERNRVLGNVFELNVNFDSQAITLFKEVRNLMWLQYQVPHSVISVAKDAKRVYPFAVSLMESVRTYQQTLQKIKENQSDIGPLIAVYVNQVHEHISKGMGLRWEYFIGDAGHAGTYIRDFASIVGLLQEKTDSLIQMFGKIKSNIDEMQRCEYRQSEFSRHLTEIQQILDRLNIESYSNLDHWVEWLNGRIDEVFMQRLSAAVKQWIEAFQQSENANGKRITVQKHEIKLRNQVMYLDPPIEQARASWLADLHDWLGVVGRLRRVSGARYDIGLQTAIDPDQSTFRCLVNRLTDGSLERCYGLIEEQIKQIEEYVNIWLQYQALWDLDLQSVYSILDSDLNKWQQVIQELKKSRNTFDSSDSEKNFGICRIDFEQVQSKVSAKYDSWHREITQTFSQRLLHSMRDCHGSVGKTRGDLEQLTALDVGSTRDAVHFVTIIEAAKKQSIRWKADVENFRSSQKLLERQRFGFPDDWLYIEAIDGEWSAFTEIFNRKHNSMKDQIGGLQAKILAEDKLLEAKITDTLAGWDQDKPIQGSFKPEDASMVLANFESRIQRMKDDHELLRNAKEALAMEFTVDRRLEIALEELWDLKAVWSALSQVWKSVQELKETLWTAVAPRKIRQSVEKLIDITKEMPSRMRQYAAYEYLQETLKSYLKCNAMLVDLKSDALRDRHWKNIIKSLRISASYHQLTLGNLWDADLRKNDNVLREIVTGAQGEMALEEFIRQIREFWQSYSLELVNYQNKCRLIKGWEELLGKCTENVNSLSAMKLSPYYRVFEEEASIWEQKLNRIHVIFDIWIDVQRQWVYLEGIFNNNVDIKHLLPLESSRFQNINAEFMAVMKKVYKSPLVLDVVQIPNIQKSLERLAELLAKIQKALGEYLDRERSAFPRFYFVGDEDLLEIIGNNKDVLRIQKHFRKMFAGIAQIELDSEGTAITAMQSREGENVAFPTPVSVKEGRKINEWLTDLEREMRLSLAQQLAAAHQKAAAFYVGSKEAAAGVDGKLFIQWISSFQAQIVVLTVQILWTDSMESTIGRQPLEPVQSHIEQLLSILADAVLSDLEPLLRKKCEHLITELVHQRDITRLLAQSNVRSTESFDWLSQMRFYYNSSERDPLKRLQVRMANASFDYGYEYLGVQDKLVQTPLTDRCYLTLTQAMQSRLGGNPFGKAGTGKTESVKALGTQLGRFVLVFCCDENFDFQAMGRIFIGLCQVGAWGCFDEFNRLDERILSAVSQQIQAIQLGLKKIIDSPTEIDLVGKSVRLRPETAIFITLNPGYAGRSNLPDNLKKLFRSIAMNTPDRELIAQVMLFAQGFRCAEKLAAKIVPLFNLCEEQLSQQPHYDFGLRALKSVLVSAGNLKREQQQQSVQPSDPNEDSFTKEQQILIQSIRETVVPKLVGDDIPLLLSLVQDVFPAIEYSAGQLDALQEAVRKVCVRRHLVHDPSWLEKVIQLYQIQRIHHGLMAVGPSGTGKSRAWSVLLEALSALDQVESVSYVIDPKAVSKDDLYGTLDSTTREWNDGLFTQILRRIVDNVRGESQKRHWIVFDGDVDPEWVENLNSVLDDNKLLTLPNGERLNLPSNVRILFEVESLRFATLATVSRCGMIWFSEDSVVRLPMLFSHHLSHLRQESIENDSGTGVEEPSGNSQDPTESLESTVRRSCTEILSPYFADSGLVQRSLEHASTAYSHIMDFTNIRAVSTLFSLLKKAVLDVVQYNADHPDFPLAPDALERFLSKKLVLAIIWSFAGDATLASRQKMGEFIRTITTIELPPITSGNSMLDFDASLPNGDWFHWQTRVPSIEIETHQVAHADVVIPTIDTVRHEELIYAWLSEHKPLILCGPPGSGKSMSLFSALRKLPQLEVVGLNFSSATTPHLILKSFEQYCEYHKTTSGVVLQPVVPGKWVVLFCDEINLPSPDTYGTQRVISFIRQLVEHGGFWRPADKVWVRIERIQFVGACNPPTDPGRVPLSHRFLRHVPLVMVDYPGEQSLKQIYGTFTRALLKVIPSLRGYSDPLTNAMVEFYMESQRRFTPDQQAHYIYSPRELTRWVRGIYEAIRPLELLRLEGLVRIWAHEALRLFQDRLVAAEERHWTDQEIDRVACKYFSTADRTEALARPILFSSWLTKNYVSVKREELREFLKARIRVFYEEELDVKLVLFDDLLEHVLRIDRVFHQMQGHMLLIGVSGCGKTTLSRFVAWMNGITTYRINVHNRYTAEDFDEDLRTVLRRSGCKGEKICFIMDESNVIDPGFLERMNTLLANGEVPGLFEGDEYTALMNQCKEGATKDGLLLESADELYRWFVGNIIKNLHVVFTMNPPEGGLGNRAATSPALFNRCVLDWFGDWSNQAFYQVAKELTAVLDIDLPEFKLPSSYQKVYREMDGQLTYRDVVVDSMVYCHRTLFETNARLAKRQGRVNYATPRHYLDFIQHYVKLFNEKRNELEDHQRHLNVGLDKLNDTVEKVEDLRKNLAVKKIELEKKSAEANDKLQKMVAEQQEAEQKKQASLEIQAALQQQNKEIESRRRIVLADLAEAEPAVIEAQKSVSNIKKQHLTEVRSMANPPDAVKMAMESVCVLLGHEIDSWKTVQQIIRRDDFIPCIVNYETEKSMTAPMRERMRRDFLAKPDFNFETVNRASKACGPLVQWVIAQVRYSEILHKVGPLREEVQQLEDTAESTRTKARVMEKMIQELEGSINRYKEEYAVLISETQMLKTEMEKVKTKVERSVKLVDNLSSERQRWQSGSEQFGTQIETIVGDVLLSAAFMAYSGFFDQHYREQLFIKWSDRLMQSGIRFRSDLSLAENLSTADIRLQWHSQDLPEDDLCIENAIIMQRSNRYPLIIDPSGQAVRFLQKQFSATGDRRLTVTSFLDDSFLKNLESALRFGNPLLIQDAETMDPILNPVLNKELYRAGGRVLIRLGDQEIDFSPSFQLFLTTRDPSTNFPPDVCSRVTFVNFTVTRASLQSQCLSRVLKSERPDTDQKRTDLLKLQGEFVVRLRFLEKSLLQSLIEARGNLLDDDTILSTLEQLKRESTDIASRMAETNVVMAEIERVTAIYRPFAQSCSSVYFAIDQMATLNHFYQFSLDFFYEIFSRVVYENPRLTGVTDPAERLHLLTDEMFREAFLRCSRSILNDDLAVLGLTLAQIRLRQQSSDQSNSAATDELDKLFDLMTTVATVANEGTTNTAAAVLTAEQRTSLGHLASNIRSLANVSTIGDSVWAEFLADQEPEKRGLPIDNGYSGMANLVSQLHVIKALRADRLVDALLSFVGSVFADPALFSTKPEVDLTKFIQRETNAGTPVIFASIPGFDASFKVEQLAQSVNASMASIAMGSPEGFHLAEKAIQSASRSGGWVLLKNLHLAPRWIANYEKKLHSLRPHQSFRLILTMETHPGIPTNLLRMGRVIMSEPLPGIKANILGTFHSLPLARIEKAPAERGRLYFMLCWLHAIIQERLRFAPLGWSKPYEFNDADQECALETIDAWLDASCQGRANIPPERIPWDALRSLLKQTIYGGKLDNDFDQLLLNSFVDSLFTAKSYEIGFRLVEKIQLTAPEGTRVSQYLDWAKQLPDRQHPSWLDLEDDAEKLINRSKGEALLAKIRKLKSLSDEEELAYVVEESANATSNGLAVPSWMAQLMQRLTAWISMFPETVSQLVFDANKSPLERFIARESQLASQLLSVVRRDLSDLNRVLEGSAKHTNHTRSLMQDLVKGVVPLHWRKYKSPVSMSLGHWFEDFKKRLQQVDENSARLTAGKQLGDIWLGGLFMPEAFITATRQTAAQLNRWSLEELEMSLSLQSGGDNSFPVIGLYVQGAEWSAATNGKVKLSSQERYQVDKCFICWTRRSADRSADDGNNQLLMALPVYLSGDRAALLFHARFSVAEPALIYKRGVALLANAY